MIPPSKEHPWYTQETAGESVAASMANADLIRQYCQEEKEFEDILDKTRYYFPKSVITGIECSSSDPSRVGVVLRGVSKDQIKKGDVIVSATYPEHEKLKALNGANNVIGQFIEWMQQEKGWSICFFDNRYDEYFSVSKPIETILAEYFKISQKKLEDEKRAMLEALRKQHDEN